jgi:hypothetical protein
VPGTEDAPLSRLERGGARGQRGKATLNEI